MSGISAGELCHRVTIQRDEGSKEMKMVMKVLLIGRIFYIYGPRLLLYLHVT